MFELAKMHDVVHIAASELGTPLLQAINDALSDKYLSKVVPNLGLCIAIYDVVRIGESHLYTGNAAHHTDVDFRVVIFRPFVGEVLMGKMVSCDETGVRISLDFFDEIYVPSNMLQPASEWDEREKVFVWKYGDDSLYFDMLNKVFFRVDQLLFREPSNEASTSAAPSLTMGRPTTPEPTAAGDAAAKPQEQPVLRIVAGMDKSGLGCVQWWRNDPEPDDE